MKKLKGKFIVLVVLLVLIASAAAAYLFIPNKDGKTEIEQTDIITDIVKPKEKEYEFHDEWLKNKEINDDYVFNVEFSSGLINLPIVQAKGELEDYDFYAFNGSHTVSNYDGGCEGGTCTLNDVYLRTDWATGKYELGGTCFMDYRNSIDDQNIIVYGHLYPRSMDANRELMFSGLDLLLDEKNYKENKDIYVKFENEEKHYEIVYVYLFDIRGDDYDSLQYYRTEYEYDYFGDPDPGYYQRYIDNVEKRKQYDTGLHLTPDDKTLTLQTCYDGNNYYHEIVVAREVED